MILPKREDTIHRAWLFRLLSALADNNFVVAKMAFKGGSCATMRGWLNRFSIDLDFDFIGRKDEVIKIRQEIEKIADDLGLAVKDKSQRGVQYFLKYETRDSSRNTIKLDAFLPPPKSNQYEPVKLDEIDRVILCQTQETMVANKLVTPLDRFAKTGSIAGRDIYDIHWFLMNGFSYEAAVIKERQKLSLEKFFSKLIDFIEKEVKQKYIDEDLNFLLPSTEFSRVRKILKAETLRLLKDELRRVRE
ncbi:MAG: nucleotidyl transferase AbiEii/AbiGii toxin family protein [Patescibacteria group bacterium]